jgi:anti-sigma28 factor (negative regulator of flagellin synthesis)
VEELRQAMAAGNFPVQVNRIATAMISSLKP